MPITSSAAEIDDRTSPSPSGPQSKPPPPVATSDHNRELDADMPDDTIRNESHAALLQGRVSRFRYMRL